MKKIRIISLILTLALAITIFPTTAYASVSSSDDDEEPVELKAKVSNLPVLLNGENVSIPMYIIAGNNYVKLRDLGVLLGNTSARFDIGFTSAGGGTVLLTSGVSYTPTKDDMKPLAEGLSVQASTGKVELDGERVELIGYALGNYNFYQLRSVGNTLDFAVYWHETERVVVIDTSYPSSESDRLQEETKPVVVPPAPSAKYYLVNGLEVNDENIRNTILALKETYPEGMSWTDDNTFRLYNLYPQYSYFTGYACYAFIMICFYECWGDVPITRRYYDFDSIHVGDHLRINKDHHSVTVLEKYDDYVIICEGNYNSSIHWGRKLTREKIDLTYGETIWPVELLDA